MAYMDSIPYTVSNQKVFAMILQLGKPSALFTLSASEIHWTGLLELLQRLRVNTDEVLSPLKS